MAGMTMHTLRSGIDSVLVARDKIYFFDRVCSSIWCADADMNNLEFLRSIDQDLDMKSFPSFGIFEYEDSIYIGSQTNALILEYRLKENKFYKYKAYDDDCLECMYNCISYEEKIFLLPVDLNKSVFIFDMKNRCFVEDNPIISKCGKVGFICQNDNWAYMPEFGGHVIYEYNMHNGDVKKENFPKKIKLGGVYKDGDSIYATDIEEGLVWQMHDGHEVSRLKGNCHKSNIYGKLMKHDKYLIALPRFGNIIYLYDTIEKRSFEIRVPVVEKMHKSGNASLLFGYYIKGNKIIYLPWGMPGICILDLDEKTLIKRDLQFAFNRAWLERFPIIRERDLELVDYIVAVKVGINDSVNYKEHDKTCGMDIYRKVTEI